MATNAWIEVQIIQKRLEADDVVSMILRSRDGAPLPRFEAGAHIDLEIAPNLVRQYSLCNSPESNLTYEVAILREPQSRGGSQAVHDLLQVGQFVRISAPRNHFPLETSASRSLLFAGGIGITPILCMAERLEQSGGAYELHYCARTQSKMAYRDRIASSGVAGHCTLHFDDGPAEQQVDLPALLAAPDSNVHVYVCGPGGFIDAVLRAAAEKGWPEEQLHREFFTVPDGRPASEEENDSFTVVLASSGTKVEVPADKSIVEALSEHGVYIATSCSEGICGTCVVHVIEGTPDHRDYLFSDAEHAKNDRLTTCCSRSKSATLVLDL